MYQLERTFLGGGPLRRPSSPSSGRSRESSFCSRSLCAASSTSAGQRRVAEHYTLHLAICNTIKCSDRQATLQQCMHRVRGRNVAVASRWRA